MVAKTGELLRILPLNGSRWEDFEKLFGPRGACGGCWCMYWKLPRKVFDANKGEGNRQFQKETVGQLETPGLIGYLEDEPVGWIAIEPRQNYPGLARSRILAAIDDKAVWSIPCFFVGRHYRNRGFATELIRGAVEYAVSMGAEVVEGYPTDPKGEKMPAPFVFTGLATSFQKAGFVEAARRSEKRPIMRYSIEKRG